MNKINVYRCHYQNISFITFRGYIRFCCIYRIGLRSGNNVILYIRQAKILDDINL